MIFRNALPEEFDFILKLTRQIMERIVREEWNADWERDVEPNFVNLWIRFIKETESGILIERELKENDR